MVGLLLFLKLVTNYSLSQLNEQFCLNLRIAVCLRNKWIFQQVGSDGKQIPASRMGVEWLKHLLPGTEPACEVWTSFWWWNILFPSSAQQSAQNKLILILMWWKRAIFFILIRNFTFVLCGSLGLTRQKFHSMENSRTGKMLLGLWG